MKKSFRTALLILALFAQSCAVSRYATNASYPVAKVDKETQGSLEEIFFDSSEPGMTKRRAYVYLPEGYYDSLSTRYPVLYLLHGARGNECVWIEKGGLLESVDSLAGCGAMSPTIVVLPNVNQYNDEKDYGKARLKGAMESFYEVDGTVEVHFIEDVVRGTDSLLRTIPDKEHRAVAGLSIGAMQSIWLSANFPDQFAYVGMFSPMIHPFLKSGPDNSFYRHLNSKQKIQFQDPPKVYMMTIGKSDFFHPRIEGWSKSLSKKGYSHEYICTDGGHQWILWSEYCREFMERLWK